MKLNYNHNYTLFVRAGGGTIREFKINPAKDSSYSESDWDALSLEEREDWLNSECENWFSHCFQPGWRE